MAEIGVEEGGIKAASPVKKGMKGSSKGGKIKRKDRHKNELLKSIRETEGITTKEIENDEDIELPFK